MYVRHVTMVTNATMVLWSQKVIYSSFSPSVPQIITIIVAPLSQYDLLKHNNHHLLPMFSSESACLLPVETLWVAHVHALLCVHVSSRHLRTQTEWTSTTERDIPRVKKICSGKVHLSLLSMKFYFKLSSLFIRFDFRMFFFHVQYKYEWNSCAGFNPLRVWELKLPFTHSFVWVNH